MDFVLGLVSVAGCVLAFFKQKKDGGFLAKLELHRNVTIEEAIELGQATEVVTSYSKMLKSIKETFESIINMESNRYINRLTMWNIVLVIPTVIVGYYGMNVALPFAESPFAAMGVFVVIVLLLIGFAFFSWFKTKSLH